MELTCDNCNGRRKVKCNCDGGFMKTSTNRSVGGGIDFNPLQLLGGGNANVTTSSEITVCPICQGSEWKICGACAPLNPIRKTTPKTTPKTTKKETNTTPTTTPKKKEVAAKTQSNSPKTTTNATKATKVPKTQSDGAIKVPKPKPVKKEENTTGNASAKAPAKKPAVKANNNNNNNK